MDTEQAFQLIDSILPFEVCLYYQIIPLSLQGTTLKLGIVNPQDSSALDYVRRILAYLNCSFKTQVITSEQHHAMLSAYLNYSGTIKPKETARKARPQLQENVSDRATLIESNQNFSSSFKALPEVELTQVMTAQEIEQVRVSSPLKAKIQQKLEKEKKLAKDRLEGKPSSLQEAANHLPVLEVQAQHLSDPIEVLLSLPPKQLLEELLARVLNDGIGRLYFERQKEQGRILWSKNGILQSILPSIDPSVFQGLINELKRLAQTSLISVKKLQQIDIERNYQGQRLLLSLRIMQGEDGEEATLQVLRGAALKFYQQQQINKLSRDAVSLAQQLQQKLYEIRERSGINSAETEVLLNINKMLEGLDQELKEFNKLQFTKQSNDQSS